MKGYHSAFAHGKTVKWKGVAGFFKKDGKIEICEEEYFQFIKFQWQNFVIFCLYISKGCSYDILVQSLEAFGFNDNQHTYLVGDLNFDATGKNTLTKYLTKLNFVQMVNRATHLDGHILDHVYVPQNEVNFCEIHQHYAYYSDHDGIIVSLKNNIDQ